MLEMLVLVVGQVGDQDGRLALDQADQADRPAGDGVGDEQLLAVDDVVVAVEHGSGPQGGQVGAGARLGQRERREPLAAGQPGQVAALLLGAAEGPERIDGADAAVDRGQARRPSASIVAMRVRNGRECGERRPLAAVLRIDQQAPVAGAGQVAQDGFGDLPFVVEERPRVAMAADDVERVVHRPAGSPRETVGGCDWNRSIGNVAAPDRAVDRALRRLVAGREERLDLVVGPVERAGLPRLLLALAAQLQRGLDEVAGRLRLRLVLLRLRLGQIGTCHRRIPRAVWVSGDGRHPAGCVRRASRACDRRVRSGGAFRAPASRYCTGWASSQSSRIMWAMNGARKQRGLRGEQPGQPGVLVHARGDTPAQGLDVAVAHLLEHVVREPLERRRDQVGGRPDVDDQVDARSQGLVDHVPEPLRVIDPLDQEIAAVQLVVTRRCR